MEEKNGLILLVEKAKQSKTKSLILSGKKLDELEDVAEWCWDFPWKEINLSSNRIKHLSSSLFDILTLNSLILSRNQLSKIPDSIGELSNLKILDCSRNNLSNIPSTIWRLSCLRSLLLMQNDLVHFPPNCFGTGEDIRIECLLLGQNHLSSLPSSFLSLTRLQNLSLANNKINNGEELLKILPYSLLELDLSSNQLTFLPESISRFSFLSRLWLQRNQIQTVSSQIGKLPCLREFDLSSNHLTELPDVFNKLVSLHTLNISYNHISTFPPSLCTTPSLSILDLSYNSLSSLPLQLSTVETLQQIKTIGNPWSLPFLELKKKGREKKEKEKKKRKMGESEVDDFRAFVASANLDWKSEEWRIERDQDTWGDRYTAFHGGSELFGDPPLFIYQYFLGQNMSENLIKDVHDVAFSRLTEGHRRRRKSNSRFSFKSQPTAIDLSLNPHRLNFARVLSRWSSFRTEKSVISSYLETVQLKNNTDAFVRVTVQKSNEMMECLKKEIKSFTFSVSRYNVVLAPHAVEELEFQIMPLKAGRTQFMFWVDVHPCDPGLYLIPIRHFMWVDLRSEQTSSLPELPYEMLKGGKLIATGGEAEITKVKIQKEMGWIVGGLSEVAVKQFHFPAQMLDVLKPSDIQELQGIKSFRNEMMMLSACCHPNVIRAIAICCEPPHFCLVTEFFPLGDLSSLLTNFEDYPVLSSHLLIRFAWDIAEGLNCLHQNRIVHNDMKASNCFVCSLDLDAPVHIKIGDFGVSKRNGSQNEDSVGTLFWMAPELLGELLGVSSSPDSLADAYSYGILLWEIFSREKDPYPDLDLTFKADLIQAICGGKRPSSRALSPSTPLFIVNIMRKCLDKVPSRRMPMDSILFRFQEEIKGEIEENGNGGNGDWEGQLWGVGKGDGVSAIDSLSFGRRSSSLRRGGEGGEGGGEEKRRLFFEEGDFCEKEAPPIESTLSSFPFPSPPSPGSSPPSSSPPLSPSQFLSLSSGMTKEAQKEEAQSPVILSLSRSGSTRSLTPQPEQIQKDSPESSPKIVRRSLRMNRNSESYSTGTLPLFHSSNSPSSSSPSPSSPFTPSPRSSPPVPPSRSVKPIYPEGTSAATPPVIPPRRSTAPTTTPPSSNANPPTPKTFSPALSSSFSSSSFSSPSPALHKQISTEFQKGTTGERKKPLVLPPVGGTQEGGRREGSESSRGGGGGGRGRGRGGGDKKVVGPPIPVAQNQQFLDQLKMKQQEKQDIKKGSDSPLRP